MPDEPSAIVAASRDTTRHPRNAEGKYIHRPPAEVAVEAATEPHSRSEVSGEPMTLRELADTIERAFRPVAAAVRDAVAKASQSHADGSERPAEGTAQGEAPGGAEGPSLTLPPISLETMFETLMEVVAERDGLRGKVEAVRALCDEADRNPRDDWRGDEIWAVDTDKIRAVLDGEA